MTDREKLIELLLSGEKTVQCEHSPDVSCDGMKCAFCERVEIADRLIANGVTFATDKNDGAKMEGWGMYKSPIEIVYGGLQTQLEGEILRAVQKVDVVVDKNDLIRALAYDRGQYEKGFQDGVESVQRWISVEDRLPNDEKPVLVYYGFMRNENASTGLRYTGTLSYFCFDHKPHWQHESTGLIVTHWMPLPESPKGERL